MTRSVEHLIGTCAVNQPTFWRPIAILLLSAGVCLALAVAWFLLLRPGGLTDPRARRITFSSYRRIEKGMTEAQVNQILGVPPGDYRAEPGFILVGPGHIRLAEGEDATGGKLVVWYIPRHHVEVCYDREGRVLGKYWLDSEKVSVEHRID